MAMKPAILFLAACAFGVMKKASVCGTSIYYIRGHFFLLLFLLFIGGEWIDMDAP